MLSGSALRWRKAALSLLSLAALFAFSSSAAAAEGEKTAKPERDPGFYVGAVGGVGYTWADTTHGQVDSDGLNFNFLARVGGYAVKNLALHATFLSSAGGNVNNVSTNDPTVRMLWLGGLMGGLTYYSPLAGLHLSLNAGVSFNQASQWREDASGDIDVTTSEPGEPGLALYTGIGREFGIGRRFGLGFEFGYSYMSFGEPNTPNIVYIDHAHLMMLSCAFSFGI